ncbi:MAG: TlpA disulfide reductase family protein [Ferruginibacter sp.]
MQKLSLFIVILFACSITSAQTVPSWKISDVSDYYSKKSDSVYVVSFWATFCKPCVAEIPYLQTITKKYEGQKAKLLLVSLDLPIFYPNKILSFAKRNNFTADIVWLNESDADHFCPVIDKKWSGSMPATLFANAATGYRKFIESPMTAEEFENELKMAIAGK